MENFTQAFCSGSPNCINQYICVKMFLPNQHIWFFDCSECLFGVTEKQALKSRWALTKLSRLWKIQSVISYVDDTQKIQFKRTSQGKLLTVSLSKRKDLENYYFMYISEQTLDKNLSLRFQKCPLIFFTRRKQSVVMRQLSQIITCSTACHPTADSDDTLSSSKTKMYRLPRG